MKTVIKEEENKMNYYQFPQFPQPYYPPFYQGQPQPQQPQFTDEQSYVENILRLNLGKEVTVYMNFENSQYGSKVFKGRLEAAGKDHIIISDPLTGTRYLLLSIYLDYITFDEEINYYYPYQQTLTK
jgi:spore germination protein Q